MFNAVCRRDELLINKGSNSNVGVICCWSILEAKALEYDDYAVIGNLYSFAGIDFIIRNLLANPQINVLHINGRDITKAGYTLFEFFTNSIEDSDKGWKIKSANNAYIGKDIWVEDLESLRKGITVHYYDESDVDSSLFYEDKQKSNRGISIYHKPDSVIEAVSYKENFNTLIEADDICSGWVKILNNVMRYGRIIDTHYGSKTKELLNLVTVIKSNELEPWDFTLLPCTEEELNEYVPRVLTNTKYENCKYTYGNRLRDWNGVDQIQAVIEKLKSDNTTKGAVMSLWRESDTEAEHGTPCLNHVWVRVVDKKCHITALMRSNDMFRAWPLNVYAVGELQKHICEEVGGIEPSDITIISESAHIYEDCWKEVYGIINEDCGISIRDTRDSKGIFLISITSNDEIEVIHIYGEQVVKRYVGTHPNFLVKELVDDNCIGSIAHALYLGRELEKAYMCIKRNEVYIQDEEI